MIAKVERAALKPPNGDGRKEGQVLPVSGTHCRINYSSLKLFPERLLGKRETHCVQVVTVNLNYRPKPLWLQRQRALAAHGVPRGESSRSCLSAPAPEEPMGSPATGAKDSCESLACLLFF